jgi:hypothetical protein
MSTVLGTIWLKLREKVNSHGWKAFHPMFGPELAGAGEVEEHQGALFIRDLIDTIRHLTFPRLLTFHISVSFFLSPSDVQRQTNTSLCPWSDTAASRPIGLAHSSKPRALGSLHRDLHASQRPPSTDRLAAPA